MVGRAVRTGTGVPRADPTAPRVLLPERAAAPVRALRLGIGVAGALVALALLVPTAATLPALWLPFLVLVAAMWITAPFRLELASGIGTVTFGVGVAVLAFLAQDVEPAQALLLWILSIALFQIVSRRQRMQVVYWTGLATLSGGAFLLVLSLFPDTGWWPVLAAVPAVLAYGAISISAEYLQAWLTLAALPDVPRPTLRIDRVLTVLALNAALAALAYGAHLSSGVQRIELGAGLEIRSANTLLLVALVIAVVSQRLRRTRIERKLDGVIEAALALPWGGSGGDPRDPREVGAHGHPLGEHPHLGDARPRLRALGARHRPRPGRPARRADPPPGLRRVLGARAADPAGAGPHRDPGPLRPPVHEHAA